LGCRNQLAQCFLKFIIAPYEPEGNDMKATEILTREHTLIQQALKSLSRAQKKIEENQQLPKDFFEKALVFLREFADEFHHFKEEYLLFGLLALKKDGAFDGPIGSLRFQHERCRACIDEISNSLNGYAERDEIATTRLLENLAAYISLLRRHIYEEEHIFFKMAEEELSKEEEDILAVQFKKEDQKMGAQTFYEQKRKLLDEMEALLNSENV
jgi:hemerythrin-like domain-containing protein